MQGIDVADGVERKVADGNDGEEGQDDERQNLPFAHAGGGLPVLNHTHGSFSLFCFFSRRPLTTGPAKRSGCMVKTTVDKRNYLNPYLDIMMYVASSLLLRRPFAFGLAEIVPGQRSGSAAPGSLDTDQTKQSIGNQARHKRFLPSRRSGWHSSVPGCLSLPSSNRSA